MSVIGPHSDGADHPDCGAGAALGPAGPRRSLRRGGGVSYWEFLLSDIMIHPGVLWVRGEWIRELQCKLNDKMKYKLILLVTGEGRELDSVSLWEQLQPHLQHWLRGGGRADQQTGLLWAGRGEVRHPPAHFPLHPGKPQDWQTGGEGGAASLRSQPGIKRNIQSFPLRDPSSLLPLFVRLVVFLPMMHRTTTTLRQILVSP